MRGLPENCRRVAVVGVSGSGKSTWARALAEERGWPHLELDRVYHQADWTPLPAPAFRARVGAFIEKHPCWVIDGNYSAVRDLVWTAADTVVWIDLPRWRTMASLLRRTARRAVGRTELWNGNRERLENWTHWWDPERSLFAWAWTRHGVYRAEYAAAMGALEWSHLRFLRVGSRSAAAALLGS